MREVTSTAPGPSRRLVTAGALAAAVTALAGCGIRLEDDAPRVPLVPTRSPIEGEDALVRLLGAIEAAAAAPVEAKTPISALLAPLHATQATVLHDALRQRGVPEAELPGAPSATASPSGSTQPSSSSSSPTSAASTGSPSPSASTPPTSLAAVEDAVATSASQCHEAELELRPTVLAIAGQAHAALDLAGRAQDTKAAAEAELAPQTEPTWSHPEQLVPLIDALRTATYLLEVAAARSTVKVRDQWLEGIARLQRVTAELVDAAGDAAPQPSLGQPLPHPVTTPTEAATLATEAMTALLDAFGSNLRPVADADPVAAFAKVPRWLGAVAAQGHRHGIRLTAFPGLK